MSEWQDYLDEVSVNESGTSGQDTLPGSIANDSIRGLGQADRQGEPAEGAQDGHQEAYQAMETGFLVLSAD